MLPMPGFFEPERVGELYVERAGLVAAEAERFARAHAITPAREDTRKIAAFGIDVQVAFCHPEGSLFVPGAQEDTARALRFLYGHLGRITALYLSLDTHAVHQIFHPCFWVDAEGRHPPPLTPITRADVQRGRWVPAREREACLEYVRKLEEGGKYVLTIWPYHALLGGASHALVPAMMELAIFHAIARDTPTVFRQKGQSPLTENYSVLSPEVTELGGRAVGGFDESLFDALMRFDRVYVFGQAKSHCVLSTLRDMQAHIQARDPALARKVYVLEDAMSPVPAPPIDPLPPALDFPAVAARAMEDFARAGMNVVRTTDPL